MWNETTLYTQIFGYIYLCLKKNTVRGNVLTSVRQILREISKHQFAFTY